MRGIRLVAAIVAAAVIVLAAVLLLGRGGGDDTTDPGASAQTPGQAASPDASVQGRAETQALLDGVPQQNFAIGDPNAPVTLLEYIDLQCPFCKEHQLDVQPELVKELVRTKQAMIAFVPLAFLGPESVAARNVFMRLAAKNRGWDFANLFYFNQGPENSGYVTEDHLRRLVAQIPGTTAADASPAADPALEGAGRAADALAQAVLTKHDSGTPGFSVGPTGGPPADYTWISSAGGKLTAQDLIEAVRKERTKVLGGDGAKRGSGAAGTA